jgi:hypothetical protein
LPREGFVLEEDSRPARQTPGLAHSRTSFTLGGLRRRERIACRLRVELREKLTGFYAVTDAYVTVEHPARNAEGKRCMLHRNGHPGNAKLSGAVVMGDGGHAHRVRPALGHGRRRSHTPHHAKRHDAHYTEASHTQYPTNRSRSTPDGRHVVRHRRHDAPPA